MKGRIYNSTDGPLVVDPDGRILSGREHGTVELGDPSVVAHVAAGRAIEKPEPDPAPEKATADDKPPVPAPTKTRIK